MMQFEQGGIKYIFYWRGNEPPPEPYGSRRQESAEVGFGSPQQATLFLRRFSNMWEFRTLVRSRFGLDCSRWRDADVITKLSDEMVKKHLLVLKRWEKGEGPSRAEGQAAPAPRRQATEVAPPPEMATFPPNHDGNAQAETLINAAQDGVPFCEECEKARQQNAA